MGYGLEGKTALVTGSTTGIGEAAARCLAEAGVAVMITGRDAARGQRVAASIASQGGRSAFRQCNLTDSATCESLVDATIKEFGRLDILINNAGILYTVNALATTDEQWLSTFQVNVHCLFFLSRAAIRHMKAKGGGAIVNVASEWGLNGEPNHVAYCASKGAVVQITRCLALDHATDNIRVNSVCPGEIHTDMVDKILATKEGDVAENLKALASGIPMRRLASPTEVGRVIRFLASADASYITGANLTVDGGNDATGGPYP